MPESLAERALQQLTPSDHLAYLSGVLEAALERCGQVYNLEEVARDGEQVIWGLEVGGIGFSLMLNITP